MDSTEPAVRLDEGRSYLFPDRPREERRLRSQAELFDPMTERAFRAAGLGDGMRVLDLGSGAGDVAMLAGRMVGTRGEVVGVERDPTAVASANARAGDAGLASVHFIEGDAQKLDVVEGPFDAVVGRLILMYLPDPAAALSRAAGVVRPGGLLCFQEGDIAYEWAYPMTPLWVQARGWVLETLTRLHIPPRMGLALPATFLAAGLPVPETRVESFVRADADMPVWGWANVVADLVPLMEQLGVATVSEVQPDNFTSRLLAELRAEQGAVIGPPLTAAWCYRP
jgi:SAM-dependent methyltransferase